MRILKRACYAVVIGLCLPLASAGVTVAADPLTDARAAFDTGRYEDALQILSSQLEKSGASPNALELRIRTYLKLGQPDKAVADYLRWSTRRGKDDARLLREVCVKVIAGAVGDMREQMR